MAAKAQMTQKAIQPSAANNSFMVHSFPMVAEMPPLELVRDQFGGNSQLHEFVNNSPESPESPEKSVNTRRPSLVLRSANEVATPASWNV